MNNETQKQFIESFNEKARETTEIAENHGWGFEPNHETLAMKIALIHSELSEALEGLRHGNPKSEKIPEFTQLEEEFADVIIRIMHVGKVLGLRLPEAIIAKDKYNNNRPYKHGGKLF